MTWRILGRLVWKELRGDYWLWLGLMALAMPVVIKAWMAYPYVTDRSYVYFVVVFPYTVALVVGIAMVGVWGQDTRAKQDYAEVHLSVHPVMIWLTRNVMPVIIAALIGAWAGFLFYIYTYGFGPSILPLAYAVVFAALCTGSRLISVVTGPILATVVAVTWGYISMDILVSDTFSDYWRPNLIGTTLSHSNALGAAFLTMLLHTVAFKRRVTVRTRFALAATGILVFAFMSLVPAATRNANLYSWLITRDSSTESDPEMLANWYTVFSPDSAQILSHSMTTDNQVMLHLEDAREDKEYTRVFPVLTYGIGLTGGTEAYLVQEGPGPSEVTLIAWNWQADTVREITAIPTRSVNAVEHDSVDFGNLDHQFGFVSVPSMAGTGSDLWLIDLKTGESSILIANRLHWGVPRQAAKAGDRVFILRYPDAFEINARTKKMHAIKTPEEVQDR